MYKKIIDYCQQLESDFESIPEKRKEKLNSSSNYISSKLNEGKTPKLIVICTHNSRRSHLGQLWLAVGAEFYNLPKIETYSGGTEATAFNPRAVDAVRRAGFDIESESTDSTNPAYNIRWKSDMEAYQAFSTRFDEAPNPTKEFGSIMVCSEADAECPLVPGCDFRLSLPFHDPKAFDDTALQESKYDERCKQIGAEMLYVMSKVETK